MTSAVFFLSPHDKERNAGIREVPPKKKGKWRTFVRSVDARKPGNSFVEYTRNGPP